MEAPCLFRRVAIDALDLAGISWRLAFVSASLAGVWAATAAGLGLAVRTSLGLPANLRALGEDECGLPPLPSLAVKLHRAEAEPGAATQRLAAIVAETLREAIARSASA